MSVTQKFVGDNAELMRSYSEILAQQAKLEQKLADHTAKEKAAAKVSRELHAAERSAMQAKNRLMTENAQLVQAGVTQLTSMVAGYASLQGVLSTVSREMEHQDKLRKAAQATNLTLADAQSGLVKNLGAVPLEEASAFLARVSKTASDDGFDAVQFTRAVGDTLSAVGGNQDKALEAVQAAAPLFRGNEAQMAEFASRIPAMAESMKSSMVEAAAEMLAIQGQARIISLGAFKTASQAIATSGVYQAGVDQGVAVDSTGALFSAIGARLDDAEGSVSATAVSKLSAVLAEVVPEQISTIERLRKVQQSPELQAAALKLYGSDSQTVGVVRELVSSSDSITAKKAEQAFDALRQDGDQYNQVVTNLKEASGQLKQQVVNAVGEAAQTTFETSTEGQILSLRAQRRKEFENAVDAASTEGDGTFGLYRSFAKQMFRWSDGGTSDGGQIDELRSEWAPQAGPDGKIAIQKAIIAIESINAQLEALNRKQDEQLAESRNKKQTPSGQPGAAAIQTNQQTER
jgi:hypothetical protein